MSSFICKMACTYDQGKIMREKALEEMSRARDIYDFMVCMSGTSCDGDEAI